MRWFSEFFVIFLGFQRKEEGMLLYIGVIHFFKLVELKNILFYFNLDFND
jgi:hypothetical protein